MKNKVNQDIVEWISKPENEELLETIKLIKEESVSEDWLENLSDSERDSLQTGIEDHKKGNTLSSDEFWAKHA